MNNKISLTAQIQNCINFPVSQTKIPLVKNVRIANLTYAPLENLTLVIRTSPKISSEFIAPVKYIGADSSLEISPVPLNIDLEALLAVTEKTSGTISFSVMENGNLIGEEIQNLKVLPFRQWTGVLMLPELIASYVVSRGKEMESLMRNAGLFLEQSGFSRTFEGYNGGFDYVKAQMSALYNTLVQNHILPDNSPADFEKQGITLRFPQEVLKDGVGGILDMSLLYAAALENAGLNPMLLFFRGQVIVGCWTENENFAECIQENLFTIKGLVKEDREILTVDCRKIFADSENNNDFDASCESAEKTLENTDDFYLAIDIRKARTEGFLPLPLRFEENRILIESPAENHENTDENQAFSEKISLTKQQMWERKLLDLSLRNMLLNFRVMKNSIQIIAPNLLDLENSVAQGREFTLYPIPDNWEKNVFDEKILSNNADNPASISMVEDSFKGGKILTFETPAELENRMKHLLRQAKLSLEENGSNTLYLALGFLKWYETDTSQKSRYAPLVLIPVELKKKPAGKSYSFKMRGEDTLINITLLEYLRQEHKIEINLPEELPLDSDGVDLGLIFRTVQHAVSHKERWQVEELSFMGLFSFSKYIMWNDIKNRMSDIEKNPVVSSLISGKMEWEPSEAVFAKNDLDETVPPSKLTAVMSADSSQMKAVYAAAEGESFVLHGPPGTGKSQTITNIIANALYNGKTVLFAAEKAAALSVVEKRLNSIGLGEFCLEMHSNKANKKDILSQLEAAFRAKGDTPSEDFEKRADELYRLRMSLNDVVTELHKKREFGFSLYDAIVKYENTAAYAGKFKFLGRMVKTMEEDTYFQWRDLLYKIKTAGTECGGVTNHPLQIMALKDYSMEDRVNLTELMPKYTDALDEVKYLFKNVSKLLEINSEPTFESIHRLQSLISTLNNTGNLSRELIEDPNLPHYGDKVQSLLQSLREFEEIEGQILSAFSPEIFKYNYLEAYERWIEAEEGFSLTRSKKQKKLIGELKAYTSTQLITKENIKEFYQLLLTYSQKEHAISLMDTDGKQIFKGLWQGKNSDPDLLENTYFGCVGIIESIQNFPADEKASSNLLANCMYIAQNQGSFKTNPNVTAFLSLVPEISALEEELAYLGVDFEKVRGEDDSLQNASDKINNAKKNLSSLKAWTTLSRLCSEAVSKGMEPIIETYMEGKITEPELIPAFDCSVSFACAVNTINASPALSRFHGAQFETAIKKYSETIKRFEALTKAEIKARLLARIPDLTKASAASSEVGILLKAIKNNGRMMSIRNLFDKIPNLLHRLAPCMLMSPISAAQYIDPAYPKFDIVIFDEASQLPTSEAVGAISRGKCAVIAGDPKQLPPTSFFATNRIDEENYDKEDLESILDDCIAISMPQSHLLWHYRSRHESLISYSNMKYYGNQLYTFPSPNDLVSEVKLVHVDGVYDRGGSKQNLGEAKAVVDEVIRRLSDKNLRKNSIGIVTFNINQQNLIDDLLTDALSEHPELEQYAYGGEEPIFVKNLENVQGDERDVILFSVCYGPDKNGMVTLNFGPLNQTGGWRRLNVAITRAKKSMVIFSALRPEQIDLSRTSSEGVEGLKGFLEFAQKGQNALSYGEKSETDIIQMESIICEKIEEMGYAYKMKIGSSKYKIDICVIDPSVPDTYILGVILDGNTYKDAGSARDRNILQPSVLEGLGWSLHRMWILDWLDSPEKEIEKLQSAIEAAIKKKTEITPEEEDEPEIQMQEETSPAEESTVESPSAPTEIEESLPEPAKNKAMEVYSPFNSTLLGKTDTFYIEKSLPYMKRRMQEIIDSESPVSQKALFKKTLAAWGMRSSQKAEARMEQVSDLLNCTKTYANANVFYWKNEQNPETYSVFRVPSADPASKRNMDDIPPEELANAVKFIIENHLSLTRDDLVKECAKLFGFTRLGNVIVSSVENGIRTALARGYVKADGDRISVGE